MQGFLKPKLVLLRLSPVLLAGVLSVFLLLGLASSSYATMNSGGVQEPEGSWLVKVTIISGPQRPPFQALFTYDAGGGLVETDQTGFNPQMGLTSPGHGAWESIAEDRFTLKFVAFLFDSQGNPAGTMQVQETDTLSKDDNAYTGSATFELLNAAGTQIASGSATTQATRIRVESH